MSESRAGSERSDFQRPLVMGVLNVTPDSFSDGGKYDSVDSAIDHARLLLIGGANIIDIGGESTRPGAPRVAPEVELSRVLPVIDALVAELAATNRRDVRISVDTMNATTALAAVSAGAHIINDVSGGLADPKMFSVAAATGAEIVISHWRGFSDGMDQLNTYLDLAAEVAAELKLRIDAAIAAGVSRNKIILDPGLGFAKDMGQNWELVARLDELDKLGLPVLVGASRKRFIGTIARQDEAARRVPGSLAVALAPRGIRVNAISFASVMSASLQAALKECHALSLLASPDLAVVTALGLQERIVDTGPVHARMARWPKGTLSLYPGAEHEVMMERPDTRARFFDEACALFDLHL